MSNQFIFIISNALNILVFGTIAGFFIDTFALKIKVQSLFKTAGFLLLTIAFTLNLFQFIFPFTSPQSIIWLKSIGLWLIFAAFIFDEHSKLQFLTVIAIVFLMFIRGHELLALQAFLISITVLQIAYFTKHKDLVPFEVGIVLVTIAEFFYFLDETGAYGITRTSGDFLYIFASIAFFYWLWQYLVIRFNLRLKSSELRR